MLWAHGVDRTRGPGWFCICGARFATVTELTEHVAAAVLADLREAGELRTLEQVGWASEGAHVHLMGMDRERTEWEFRYFTVPVWVEVGREDTDE